MDFELVVAVRNLVEYVPFVYVEAFLVFLLVSFLKLSGIAKKGFGPQFANILLSFSLTGGKIPQTDFMAKKMFMTMIVAAGYFHGWKLLKPQLKKVVDAISDKLKKEE